MLEINFKSKLNSRNTSSTSAFVLLCSVFHEAEEHAHEAHGHKSKTSFHHEATDEEKERKPEETGISIMCVRGERMYKSTDLYMRGCSRADGQRTKI